MIGSVERFDKVSEQHPSRQVVVTPEVQHRFDGEASVLAAYAWGGTKLLFHPVRIDYPEQAAA